MRNTRYFIGALLLFITISSYFDAIKAFDNNNYFILIKGMLPITILDVLLVWIYSKGTAIYGSNNKQRSRWLLISVLLLSTILMLLYAFMAKNEADKSVYRSLELEKELIKIQETNKLDSLKSNE